VASVHMAKIKHLECEEFVSVCCGEERHEYEDSIHGRDVFPKSISMGACINSHNCRAYATDLADGWCVDCWDKGDMSKQRIIDAKEGRAKGRKSRKD
jgi:hypothetical protein